jgi:hypothetical protein
LEPAVSQLPNSTRQIFDTDFSLSRLKCTRGTVSDCGDDDLNDGDEVFACTPQFYEDSYEGDTFESIKGEYSFVINQPGSG